jgi:hypothetical protein
VNTITGSSGDVYRKSTFAVLRRNDVRADAAERGRKPLTKRDCRRRRRPDQWTRLAARLTAGANG